MMSYESSLREISHAEWKLYDKGIMLFFYIFFVDEF